MKKVFQLCLLSTFLFSCGPSKQDLETMDKKGFSYDQSINSFVKKDNAYGEVEKESAQPETGEDTYEDIEIRTIDGCEYVLWSDPRTSIGNIIHKANCKNPIHQNNN